MNLNILTVLMGLVAMFSIAMAVHTSTEEAQRFATAAFIFFLMLLYLIVKQK